MCPDHTHRRAALALTLAIASFGLAGCAQASGSVTADAGKGGGKPADAGQVAALRCKGCHSASKALSYRTSSPNDATEMVNDMVRRGASLSSGEMKTLVDFYLR